jgi:hypothetical protein
VGGRAAGNHGQTAGIHRRTAGIHGQSATGEEDLSEEGKPSAGIAAAVPACW